MNNIKITVLVVVLVSLFTGCGPKFETLGELKLKEHNYKAKESAKDVAFAVAKPEFVIKTKMSRLLSNGLASRLEHNANVISCHLTSELSKLILGKGITITDTFNSRNDMTFTQKRETSALYYPEITIKLNEQSMTLYDERMPLSTQGDLIVSAQVKIVMLEPLSGEKIWVKSLPINNSSIAVKYPNSIFKSSSPSQVQDTVVSVAKAIDTLLVKINDEIIKSTSKYITIEEFRFLNSDIRKLKNIKRY